MGGIKKYFCPVCQLGYTRKDNLVRHRHEVGHITSNDTNKIDTDSKTTNKIDTDSKQVNPNEINATTTSPAYHSSVGTETDHTLELVNSTQTMSATVGDTQAERFHSCVDCGQVYTSAHDLVKHINRWCPEIEEPNSKRLKMLEEEEEEDLEENPAIKLMLSDSKEENEMKWQKIVEKYLDEGMDEDQAKKKADFEITEDDKQVFFKKYADFLRCAVDLRKNFVTVDVLNEIDDLLDQGYDTKKAIQKVIRKNKNKFDVLFESDYEETDTDPESESNTDTDSSDSVTGTEEDESDT